MNDEDTSTSWVQDHRLKMNGLQKDFRDRARQAVLDHYGRFCACCKETEEMFLTIDHIDDSGAEHRREMKTSTTAIWLKQNNFPPGFQILCINCNQGRYRNGGICPHQALGKTESFVVLM